MLVNIMLVLNKLVLHLLFQVVSLSAQSWDAINHIQHQMESVQLVLNSYVKGRRARAFFLIAPDMDVAIGPAVGQPVD